MIVAVIDSAQVNIVPSPQEAWEAGPEPRASASLWACTQGAMLPSHTAPGGTWMHSLPWGLGAGRSSWTSPTVHKYCSPYFGHPCSTGNRLALSWLSPGSGGRRSDNFYWPFHCAYFPERQ